MGIDQTDILLSLVQGQDGQVWANQRTGWNKGDVSVCFWDGVLCDANDQTTVTGIFISSGGYQGTLPTELGKLHTLKELSMPSNQIRGRIPTEIASLPHLETINLAENEITGTVPQFSSPGLQSIDLSHNLLAGVLDPDLGTKHKSLTDLDLTHNKISGTIPESFAYTNKLDTLSLSENRFSGTIPASLGRAMQLRYLYIDNNYLMGTIPPEIAWQDSPLEELWLQENLLSGTIPAAIADLKSLFNFYVDGNKFTGTVPQQLCRPALNADFFEGIDMDNVVGSDVCDSVACRPGYVSFEGVYPCSMCEEQFFNPYLGRVGDCIDLNEEDILDDIYDAAHGEDWIGGVNWNVPNVPKCSLTGVGCDNNNNIITLNLKGKGLRGNLPESIGFLRFLERLDVSDNQLTGYLPSDLRWAPLEFLDVTGNEFKGIVPHELCKKEGINGNGNNGSFSCDMIACSSGYYSATGRASTGKKCVPCKEGGSFLGSKVCYQSLGSSSYGSYGSSPGGDGMSPGVAFIVSMLIISAITASVFGFIKVHKHIKSRMERVSTEDEDFGVQTMGMMS
eukprot:CAMPEP_0178963884 /NCGR_PEP_ID=MMETSP0789-20121207/15307_1 /TAXON_ID=3005 /ORGANISM="Rhizosolenia setigera, Strain CCMP 1694" /LENGTH=562 /DNA_ID=CAMNT_0020648473 /DNA_START=36 /DNA_END=1724 /DNA_ORIENTATION=+